MTLALALAMLVGAWFRKRLVIGIACALYGISFFNLHYWGFGLPFILIGSWYLVRAYRLSQKLKLAKSTDTPRLGPSGRGAAAQQAVHAAQRPGASTAQVQAGQGHRSQLSGVSERSEPHRAGSRLVGSRRTEAPDAEPDGPVAYNHSDGDATRPFAALLRP